MSIKDYADFLTMVDVHLAAMSHCALTDMDVEFLAAQDRLFGLYEEFPEYTERMTRKWGAE